MSTLFTRTHFGPRAGTDQTNGHGQRLNANGLLEARRLAGCERRVGASRMYTSRTEATGVGGGGRAEGGVALGKGDVQKPLNGKILRVTDTGVFNTPDWQRQN